MTATPPSIDWALPSGPWVAHRLNGNYDHRGRPSRPGELRGAGILETRTLTDGQIGQLRGILTAKASFGGEAMRCFLPGIGFTAGSGAEAVEILVCLRCNWFYFFQGETRMFESLSEIGVRELTEIYAELFPGNDPDKA